MSDIFISYSREDSEFVEALIMALIEYGWSVWSDKSGMAEGRPFDQQIENAISEATVTLAVWSQASVKSRWVRAEAAFALDKDKLVPLIADSVDPPLQFLHIQGINMTGWNRTGDDAPFKRLTGILSSRLDRVGRVPQLENEPNGPAKPSASSSDGISAHLVKFWRVCFPPVGRGLNEYFCERTFFITQFACAFVFFLVMLFGLIDTFAQSSSVEETRLRFIFTGPALLILMALSFTPLAKRHSQIFTFFVAFAVLLIVFTTSKYVEVKYPVTTGAATGVFLVALCVCMVMPLRVPGAALLALTAVFLHESYLSWTHKLIPPGLRAGYDLCIISEGLALVLVACFRERIMRKSFLDHDQASAKILELKERLMALAVQRHRVP